MKKLHKSKRGRNQTKRRKSDIFKKQHKSKSYIVLLIGIFLILLSCYRILPDTIILRMEFEDAKKEEIKEIVNEVLLEQQNVQNVQEKTTDIPTTETEEVKEVEETKPVAVEKRQVTSRGGDTIRTKSTGTTLNTKYRLTSYYPGDGCASTTKTGSGKSTSDFSTMKIGNKTVYTYNGMIVVAAATNELYRTGYNVKGSQTKQSDKHYFSYYNTLMINIDGTEYKAIVLDSCGAAMWQGYYRIDIFVPSSSNVIDRSNTVIKIL